MAKPRFLSKSRFKTGCECPTKLFFTGKPEYGNNNVGNAFLAALAEGGFQVGELAKLYHHGGVGIETLDSEKAVKETSELLQSKSVTLYEPALQTGNLLVRVDVLIKSGLSVQLIEVKAKSFDPTIENPFYNKTALKKGLRQISSDWEPYLLDIAYQTYVARKAFPKWKVSSFLMLADKTAAASVDGLNQRFFLKKDDRGRSHVAVAPGVTPEDLGAPVLIKVDVNEAVDVIFKNKIEGRTFEEHVDFLANAYAADQMIPPTVGGQCKSCEFRIDEVKKTKGLKSGFEKCWVDGEKLSADELVQPHVFEIWNFRKTPKLIEDGRFFIKDVTEKDIEPRARESESGLSSTERQWLQVQKIQTNDSSAYFDHEGMTDEMSRWKFPLHFIDFETTMVAIPFNKGIHPYEQMAFQFSHHVLTADGRVEHRTEYINRERGKFPNFDFVRALKTALSSDSGTIFRYAAHENTVLCQIYQQLRGSGEPDTEELIAWIETITKSTSDQFEKLGFAWEGKRNMVDLCELVKRYFYHPLTHGSNSIKKVLPAILKTSDFLQNRYAKPIYGADGCISSKNFKDWRWITKDANGSVVDPYKLLPPIFSDLDLETMDSLITDGSIADGGAAMTAYARMQFTEMSDTERDRVAEALLKYCELDTFAMVMIFEHWKHELEVVGSKSRAA